MDHTLDHNTITPSKEIAVFYDLELLYNVKRLRAPGNRTPLKNMKKKFIILITFIYCLSCANPTIVNVIGPNDSELSCKELSNEIAKANQYADEAKEAKKMDKPHNISAVLFSVSYTHLTLPTKA